MIEREMDPTGQGSRGRSLRPATSWGWCAWTAVVLLLLAMGWERVAAGYSAESRGLVQHGSAFLRAGRDVQQTLRTLPAPTRPRLAIFGSSQIATIAGTDGQPELSMPARLSEALEEAGAPYEVVDFSTAGQQVSESMVVLLLAGDTAQPRVVVLGLSLFSMLRVDVRETLLQGVDVDALRAAVLDELPADVPRADARALLEFSRRAPQRVAAHGETIQQRIDSRIAHLLERHFDSVANRQVLFDELVDAPLRRDLVSLVKRRAALTRTARSYSIGKAYGPSLAAVEVMARWCGERDVVFHVVLLPFDDGRPPVPFGPETAARVRSDVAALATTHGFAVADRSDLLDSSHFRNYLDGSPDNFHFDASGHQRLASEIAALVAPDLGRPHGPQAAR